MLTTSLSLLEKLRQPADTAAWDRFVDLYTPLLFCWACKLSMNGMEPADFVQDVFVKLVKFLPRYQHDPAVGSFRGWLRTMCMNHWRDLKRKAARQHVQATDDLLASVPTSDEDLDRFWDREYHALLLHEAFKKIEGELDETSRRVYREVVIQGLPVVDVARQLGLTPNAVSMRRFRVLRRLREELAELLD